MPRTENDTWDLASSVGATATGVAASRALASLGPDPLIDDVFAEPWSARSASTTSSRWRVARSNRTAMA